MSVTQNDSNANASRSKNVEEMDSSFSSTQTQNRDRHSADMRGSDKETRAAGMLIFTAGVNAFDADFRGTAGGSSL